MTVGKHLRRMRDERNIARHQAAAAAGISAEQLRRIETGSSRPSPKVLEALLQLYDTGEVQEARAWMALARSYFPEEVRKRVQVISRKVSQAYEIDIIEATMEWVELYYEPDIDDLKYLRAHIKSKLEQKS